MGATVMRASTSWAVGLGAFVLLAAGCTQTPAPAAGGNAAAAAAAPTPRTKTERPQMDDFEDIYSDSPEALWERYLALEHSFDPKMVGLYWPDAVLYNERHYPMGVRKMQLPFSQMRPLLIEGMPVAKSRGDISDYTDVTFEREGADRVRIKATRFNRLKQYEAPFAVVVTKGERGWRVSEEHVVSQP